MSDCLLRSEFYARLEVLSALPERTPAERAILQIVRQGLTSGRRVLTTEKIVNLCIVVCASAASETEFARRWHILALLCGMFGRALPNRGRRLELEEP